MPPKRTKSAPTLTAVDVFSGGGGLTVGLKRAGFTVVSAVEVEKNAFTTYKANHPDVHAFKQDVRTIRGSSLHKLSPTGKIDLLAGCPPCQGFSSLTVTRKTLDPRNELIREMGRLVEEVQPRAVMMENVPGLAVKGKALFDEFLGTLRDLGYVVRWGVLQVANFGVPQNRRRLVLLAGRRFVVELPEATHARIPKNGLKPWRTLRDVITGMPTPVTLAEAKERGTPAQFDWHVVRNLTKANQLRLENTRAGVSRKYLPTELRPDCHKGRDEGYHNVYGRMSWDKVPVTITGGCTTLSKGRFGHPEENRTISVREAALIQTFPRDYLFDTPYMDYACDIIGNALPCDFAEVVARQCAVALHANPVRPGRPRRVA
jgi:DNA (cytosine-5)-methyltransferase 1